MGLEDCPSRRIERRWAPRYSFQAPLEIEWGSAVLRGSIRDISSNGMFIESSDPLWVGAGFTAQIGLAHPVKVDCFVKRVEPGRGMGVAVSVTDQAHQQRFQELLQSLSTNSP
jgi:PilZ domain